MEKMLVDFTYVFYEYKTNGSDNEEYNTMILIKKGMENYYRGEYKERQLKGEFDKNIMLEKMKKINELYLNLRQQLDLEYKNKYKNIFSLCDDIINIIFDYVGSDWDKDFCSVCTQEYTEENKKDSVLNYHLFRKNRDCRHWFCKNCIRNFCSEKIEYCPLCKLFIYVMTKSKKIIIDMEKEEVNRKCEYEKSLYDNCKYSKNTSECCIIN